MDAYTPWRDFYRTKTRLETALELTYDALADLFSRPTREMVEAHLAYTVAHRARIVAERDGESDDELARRDAELAHAQLVIDTREIAMEALFLRGVLADRTFGRNGGRKRIAMRMTTILAELTARTGDLSLESLDLDDAICRALRGD